MPITMMWAGVKWMLGVYSQGWNRRRQRKGHVFQDRYKAVVVNGEEREGCYFKIVADYIHFCFSFFYY